MSFDANSLATSYIQRIRLLAGDISQTPLLEDSVYQYLYLDNNQDEVNAAIAAVENIITMLIMNPTEEDVGDLGQGQRPVSDFKDILVTLKERRYQDSNKIRKAPMIVRSDRSSWDDIDNLFNKRGC